MEDSQRVIDFLGYLIYSASDMQAEAQQPYKAQSHTASAAHLGAYV